jgi:type VI secretion system protein ImpF
MARWEPEQTVTQSVLDRLIDREPESGSEAAPTRAQSVRQLKASLRRDLEKSLYNFGLPDATSLNWDSARDRGRLARMIEQVLGIFEPRLRGIRVAAIEAAAGAQHVMRFQIEGMLEMDPAPEHISFDTLLQLSSGEYQVKGDLSAG